MPSTKEVTHLLIEWSHGDKAAFDRLMPLIYDELHGLAARYLRREQPGQTLQATALIHEVYLRLIDQSNVHWQNRAHFFAIAAQAMRRILVDRARSRHAAKRGRAALRLSLDEAVSLPAEREVDLMALDDALNGLAVIDPQKSRIIELRFFGGLSIAEAAEVLGVSAATVVRQWRTARAWLYRELQRGEGRHGG